MDANVPDKHGNAAAIVVTKPLCGCFSRKKQASQRNDDLDNVYVGTFSVMNIEIAATVDMTNYTGNVSSVVGLRQYRLTVKGAMKNSQNITVAGVVEGRADLASRSIFAS